MRFVKIMMLLLGAALATSPAAAQSIRDELIAALHAAAPDAVVTVLDPLAIKITRPPDIRLQINLDRIQAFCAANSAEDCAAEKQHFIAGMVETLVTNNDLVATQLRVVVRGDDYIKGIARLTQTKAKGAGRAGETLVDPPITAPFGPGLSLILAADYPTSTKMIGSTMIAKLGLNRDQALALGVRQVLASLPKVPTAEELDGKLMSFPDLDYGASMLLEPKRWRPLAVATGGQLFVAIPADNDVLIGTVKSGEELRKLEKLIADSYASASRGISPLVYRWSPTGWEVAR
ncbi:MAG: hypothetical protein ABIS51_10880 [Sphingomonas sp.]